MSRLTSSVLQTRNSFAECVDPDETARDDPCPQVLHWLPFVLLLIHALFTILLSMFVYTMPLFSSR